MERFTFRPKFVNRDGYVGRDTVWEVFDWQHWIASFDSRDLAADYCEMRNAHG